MAEAINPDLTMLQNLINPEVMADMISAELPETLAFTGIATIDDTLVGQPGDTVTVPRYKYIGDAVDVAEGAKIDYAKLETATDKMTIKKVGKGVYITDEAVLSGLGNPKGEGQKQVKLSIAAKIDNDVLDTAKKARLNVSNVKIDLDMIDAIENGFNEDSDERAVESDDNVTGVLFMNRKDVAKLRKAAALDWTRASELGDSILVKGVLGEVLGWQIRPTKKVKAGTVMAIKPGALRIYMKRYLMAEAGRDMDHKATKFNADQHYGVAIHDDTKLLIVNPETESDTPK